MLRAITPGLYLRNVLETTENLTLERLMKFLQSHYVEKSTTDLYQTLTSQAQSPQESAIQFTYRAMSLRQKLVVASKSPGAEIPFDDVLGKRLFLKALETGLLRDAIVSEIKPLLKNINVSDEDLIFAIGQASSADSQRNNKMNKTKYNRQQAGVHNIDSEFVFPSNDLSSNELSGRNKVSGKQNLCPVSGNTSENDIVKLLKEMQSEISSLKSEVRYMKKSKSEKDSSGEGNQAAESHQEQRKRPKCKECREKKVDDCRHCFVCGGTGHISCRCPSRDMGNEDRLRK